MEIPADVLVHNELLGMKGTRGTLLRVAPEGFYELNCRFGERDHRTYLPVAATSIIQREPEPQPLEGVEIERYGEV